MNWDELSKDENDDDFLVDTPDGKKKQSNSDSCALTVQTIQAMQESNICGNPQHFHSFQQVQFSLTPSFRRCASCEERLQTVILFGGSATPSQQVVRCVACGVVAHRSCALSSNSTWKDKCPVNAARLEKENEQRKQGIGGADDVSPVVQSGSAGERQEEISFEQVDSKGSSSLVWTDGGPPKHWATSLDSPSSSLPQSPRASPTPSPTNSPPQHHKQSVWERLSPPNSPFHFKRKTELEQDNKDCAAAPGEEQDDVLHHASQPFSAVSRALQENILAHFQKAASAETMKYSKIKMMEDDGFVDAAPTDRNGFGSIIETARTTVKLPGRVSTAAMVGGIAGGVGGLLIAGPAGAFAGCKLGQVAGALGVIAEGSITIGVVVASVATGSATAKQIQEQMEERNVLTMGEDGIAQKVLLVRPNIQIDPVWIQITEEARSSAPKPPLLQAIQTGAQKIFQPAEAARELQRRDSDITQTAEDEIPTEDKVLLLVSRILNDKTSLPGHVYRELVQAFRQRCKERETVECTGSSRARRDDAHAVIKHVAATLLEVRPQFSSSPVLTELTASAVEGLVFGQLYDLVWEEISVETADRDAAMMKKLALYEKELVGVDQESAERVPTNADDTRVCKAALEALRLLPESHTAVDKLHHCVCFLELISDHFSAMCADSLLKMACQHLFLHLIRCEDAHNMHAQIAFLEEFARDEQLLRGREGYSLVTLQAALHFLDMSTNLNDIFGKDDESEDDEFESLDPMSASVISEEGIIEDPTPDCYKKET